MSQGQYTATFTAFGNSFTHSGNTPLNCMLSAWGGIAATSGPRFEVRVPIPQGPVSLSHASTEPMTIHLAFPMQDPFAWRDLDQAGYSPGVLDIAQPPSPGELPDAMVECHLLMADRCEGHGIAPIHPTWPMPDSSIDFCSDGHEVMTACPAPGEPAYGQDAQYLVNSLDYDIHADVVHDQVTGLQWQRAVPPLSFDWWEAREHCAALTLDGATDWRLPTLKEQQTLVDDRRLQPCIDVVAFPDTPAKWFWSSTPIQYPPNEGWSTSYTDGYASIHAFSELHLVRCVTLAP